MIAGTAVILSGCGGAPPAPPAAEKKDPAAETVLPAGTPVERTRIFVSPVSKETFRIDTVKGGLEAEAADVPATTPDVITTPPGAPQTDYYAGTARKAAKLSIAIARTENFGDVSAMIATLPSMNAMVNHKPVITTTANSNRVNEEKRNVRLAAFLYAASHEDDNDFHLILGRAPAAVPQVYFTAEVSGLPPATSGSFATLKSVRDTFKNHFGLFVPTPLVGYDFYTPPIRVSIEGSLFFDMTHATGTPPGPASLRPKMPVIWEVHPVTKIVFEP